MSGEYLRDNAAQKSEEYNLRVNNISAQSGFEICASDIWAQQTDFEIRQSDSERMAKARSNEIKANYYYILRT